VKTVETYMASGPFGTRFALGAQRETRILGEYDVEIAEDSTIADPISRIVRDGFSASVRVMPCGEGSLDVEAAAELSILDDPVRTLSLDATSLGRLDLPAFASARVAGTAAIPPGGALVLVARGVSIGGGAALAVVITPTAIGDDVNALRDDENPGFEARIAEWGTAGYQPRDFLSPAARMTEASMLAYLIPDMEGAVDKVPNAADDSGFESDDAAQAEAMAAANPDTTFVAALPSRRTFVLGDGASQSAISDSLEALLAPRRLTVEVTLALVPLTSEEEAKVDPAGNADALLGAARAERAGSSIFLVPVVSGDQAAMALGREFSFLADYEVEVAQKARMADPLIGYAFSGCAAEVRATRSDDSTRVVVSVRMSATSCDEPPLGRSNGCPDLGVIEFPKSGRSAVNRRFVSEIGKADAALVGRTSDGRPLALVIAVAEP
jgi:hypothetical protein